MLLQAPEEGGRFQFAPNIRAENTENYDRVAEVLRGGTEGVVELNLQPGDFQIFEGRYSMHRVSAVEGSRARCIALFSYNERPGVIGSPKMQQDLYGRTAQEPLLMEEVASYSGKRGAASF